MKRWITLGVLGLALSACSQNETYSSKPAIQPQGSSYPCQGYVALTYDDGPTEITRGLVDELNKRGMHATFFLLGSKVEELPEVAKYAAATQQVADHTWNHPHLPDLSPSKINDELSSTKDRIQEATGKTPVYWRPPFGETDEKVRGEASKLGLQEVLWTQDSNDWRGEPVGSIVDTISTMKDGDIILMHDNDQIDLDAVPLIDESLRENRLCTGTLEKSNSPIQATDGKDPLGLTFNVKAGPPN